MRLSKNKQRKVFVFKMVDVPSDFVGTEKKIDCIGCFDCIVEEVAKSKSDEKTEKEITCKLTVPNGYHFKAGFGVSMDCPEKPDLKIISIKKFTHHCVCECTSWT